MGLTSLSCRRAQQNLRDITTSRRVAVLYETKKFIKYWGARQMFLDKRTLTSDNAAIKHWSMHCIGGGYMFATDETAGCAESQNGAITYKESIEIAPVTGGNDKKGLTEMLPTW